MAPPERFEVVEIRTRRGNAALMTSLGLGLFLFFAAIPFLPFTVVFGPMFLALTLLNFRELLRAGRRIVLDDVGFTDRTLGVGRIPWEEIEGVEVWNPGQPQLFLYLRNPERWRKRQSWLCWLAFAPNRVLGYSNFLVNLHGAEADRDQLKQEMDSRIEATRLLGPVDRPLLPGGKAGGDSGGGEEEALPGEEDL